MTTEIVMSIDCAGKIKGLHFDEFDFGFLGSKAIDRASEIVFNSGTQSWDVIIRDSLKSGSHQGQGSITYAMPSEIEGYQVPESSGFDSYEIARRFEVDWLQGCKKRSVDIDSPEGRQLALELRDSTC